jgi:hypothetical protein
MLLVWFFLSFFLSFLHGWMDGWMHDDSVIRDPNNLLAVATIGTLGYHIMYFHRICRLFLQAKGSLPPFLSPKYVIYE